MTASLASALGVAAARNSYSVRYIRISRLLYSLAIARQDGSLTNLLRSLTEANLLILDDWMRDAITIQNAQDILEVLDDRFGHSATLISSQVPVTDWYLRIPDPTLADAILDHIVHTAHRTQTEHAAHLVYNSRTSISSLPTVRHRPFKLCVFTVLRRLVVMTIQGIEPQHNLSIISNASVRRTHHLMYSFNLKTKAPPYLGYDGAFVHFFLHLRPWRDSNSQPTA